MEESPVQTPTPSTNIPPVNSTPQSVAPVKLSSAKLVTSMFILIILLLGSSVFLFYQNSQLKKQVAALSTPSPTASATSDPTANWKTYKNDKYGFEFKYPTSYQENTKISPPESNLDLFLAFTSQDYETEYGGIVSGATLNGSIITISSGPLNPKDFVSKRCDYLSRGSPQLECRTLTISERRAAIVFSQNPVYKTAFIEKGNNIISLHLETAEKNVIDSFDQIISTFKFTEALGPTGPTVTGKACTMEVKICPDGTSVGRTGPNCEFAACP